jgi:hypothetical protein
MQVAGRDFRGAGALCKRALQIRKGAAVASSEVTHMVDDIMKMLKVKGGVDSLAAKASGWLSEMVAGWDDDDDAARCDAEDVDMTMHAHEYGFEHTVRQAYFNPLVWARAVTLFPNREDGAL